MTPKATKPEPVKPVKVPSCGKVWSVGLVHERKNRKGEGTTKAGHKCPYPAGHAGTCVCRCGAPEPTPLPLGQP